ncbi:MAG: hypothetical protein NVS3B26_28980 [Mycobacteriales bacterium]
MSVLGGYGAGYPALPVGLGGGPLAVLAGALGCYLPGGRERGVGGVLRAGLPERRGEHLQRVDADRRGLDHVVLAPDRVLPTSGEVLPAGR